MKVLFDLEATQPNSSGKRHGGGKFGEIVLTRIINRGLPVSVFYDSRKWLNPDMDYLLNKKNIEKYDIAQQRLEEVVALSQSDLMYTPQLSDENSKIKGCKIIATVHGLRGYELPIDLMMLNYKSQFNFRNIVKVYLFTLFPGLKEKRINALKKTALFLSNNIDIVTVSEHSAHSIRAFFPDMRFDTSKVFYSPSTVADIPNERKNDSKYFLLVSGNRWEKNNLRAIMALDRLFSVGELSEYEVMITGSSSADEYKYTLQNPNKFHFKGYVDDNELAQLYHDAYCLIYPSLNEGFGYPPLEAMANGVPVIASPFTSIQEVCQSAAIYTNPFSVEEIMSRILMITVASLRKEYSDRGLKRQKEVKARQDSDLDKLIDYIYK